MATVSDNEFSRVWNQLHETIRREDWHGFDPYDGLNSPLARTLPGKTCRQLWTQFLKQSPINFRPLLGISKQVNPKALALGISALCLRHKTLGHKDPLEEAVQLADRLIASRSTGTERLAWGYPFDWQSRAFFAPVSTPNLICTAFGASALLDLYGITKQPDYLAKAVECAEFILHDLRRSKRGETICFSYTTRDESQVHNVNLLAAAVLARVARWAGKTEWHSQAKAAIQFSVNAQREDGSWPYGEAENQGWVDSFHTGYNLIALKQFREHTADGSFDANLQRGWRYYSSRFFLDDGTPKYYNDSVYPLDVHSAAQGILSYLEIGQDSGGAERIARWTLEHLWDERGFFYFQKTRLWTNRIHYLRWSGAWMLLAFARLLLATDAKRRDESITR